jgi:hypothetical protein
MMRGAAFPAALAVTLLLLPSCTQEAPAPKGAEPALPTLADTSSERECACVGMGECATPEAFEGQSETRDFQCRRVDGGPMRAICTVEGRFKHAAPGSRWSSWSKTTIWLRHLDQGGWCWAGRESENETTELGTPGREFPPAVRQPTLEEADRIARACGTRARLARMGADVLRLAPWRVYEPVDAMPLQRRCFYDRVRVLIARPA